MTAEERRAQVQGDLPRRGGYRVPGTVAWSEHLEAWEAYAKKFGKSQDAERIADRGGFGYLEITQLLGNEPTTWRPR